MQDIILYFKIPNETLFSLPFPAFNQSTCHRSNKTYLFITQSIAVNARSIETETEPEPERDRQRERIFQTLEHDYGNSCCL